MLIRRVILSLLFWPLLLAGCFGTTGNGSGTRTLYVDPSNSTGIADGSQAYPFTTLWQALDVVRRGDTIRVAPGTYGGGIQIEAGLLLEGESASTTILLGDGTAPVVEVADDAQGSLEIRGFQLTGGLGARGSAVSSTGMNVTLRDCLINGNVNDVEGGEAPVWTAAAVWIRDADGVIERCRIEDNVGSALGSIDEGTITVRNSILAVTSDDAIHVQGDSATATPDLKLENVTVYGSGGHALHLDQFANATLLNVILAVAAIRSIREANNAGDPLLEYCILENGYRDADTDTVFTDPADIDALDPPGSNVGTLAGPVSFVDAPGGDYHLATGSPGIDDGSPSLRDPDGTRSDRGAFGGPGGDWDDSFGTAAATYRPARVLPMDLEQLLDADPLAASAERSHPTDLDADGRLDRLTIRDGALGLWLGSRDGTERPGRLPADLGRVSRATTFDLDGDDRLDLILEVDGLAVAYLRRGPVGATFRVRALPGDLIEVWSDSHGTHDPQHLLQRHATRRGDRRDGTLLLGLGPERRTRVRILRDGAEVLAPREVHPAETVVAPGAVR